MGDVRRGRRRELVGRGLHLRRGPGAGGIRRHLRGSWNAGRKPAPGEEIEPFNKKGVEVGDDTRFAQDLEWDSLTVLDFVANIEDEFDILITMNQQAEIETVGQLVDAVEKLKG